MRIQGITGTINIPWFIYDIMNTQLIVSKTIPLGNISDTKNIVLSETPIPGLGFSPIQAGGMGNRKIAFTLPLIKRDNTVGNVLLLKQFENLRNPAYGIANLFQSVGQFTPNPKVLFYWGTGNAVPLEWFVAKCDPVHTSGFVNNIGLTQYSEISIELWLDETSLLFKAEEEFRKLGSYTAAIQNLIDIASPASF